MMMIVLLLFMRPLAKVVEVPRHILLPILFALATAGVFSLNNRMFDVFVMCAFGGLGYIFDRFRFPLPPFVLGMVLGPLIEGNFRKMLGQYGDVWPLFTQPIALTFIVLSIGSIIYSLYRRRHGGSVSVQVSSE